MSGNIAEQPEVGDGDGAELTFPGANFAAVDAVADLLGTSLGPSSRDKLIVDQLASRTPDRPLRGSGIDRFVVTSDGASILEALPLEHPVGSVLERVAGPERPGDTEVEGEYVPDGVTSTVVLLGALLREAEALLDVGLHPYTVRSGYGVALETALETLAAERRAVADFPDPAGTRHAVARTAMTGNDIAGRSGPWADLVVEAVDLVGMPDEVSFVVRTIRDGSIYDSELVRGAVLDMSERAHPEMPRRVESPTVFLLGGFENRGGLQDPQVRDGVSLDLKSADSPAEFEALWDRRRDRLVDRLVETGVDVVVARSGISTEFQRRLADAGIMGIRGVNHLDLRQVAAATGATPVMDPEDIDPAYFGSCGLVEERLREPRKQRKKRRRMVVFEGCSDPDSVAFLLRGVSGQVADQASTQLRTAAAAVALAEGARGRPSGVVPGGGAAELLVADRLRETATDHDSRVQMAVESFADATDGVVATLARNAGLDPLDTIPDLRSALAAGEATPGLSLPDGDIVDVVDAGILDAYATRRHVYVAAVEVADRLLAIDDAIDAVVSEEPPDPDEAQYQEAAEQQRDYQKEHGMR